jgi:hypothetical protein
MSVDINQVCEPGLFEFTNDTDPSMVTDAYWNLS